MDIIQGVNCPYCKTRIQAGNATSLKTEAFIGGDGGPTKTDDTYGGSNTSGGTKTTVING